MSLVSCDMPPRCHSERSEESAFRFSPARATPRVAICSVCLYPLSLTTDHFRLVIPRKMRPASDEESAFWFARAKPILRFVRILLLIVIPNPVACLWRTVVRNLLFGMLAQSRSELSARCLFTTRLQQKLPYLEARKASSDHVSADSSCFNTYKLPSSARTRK